MTLIGRLPTDLPASIFVVQHMAPENTGEALVHRLSKHKAFGCQLAIDGTTFKRGQIYIAPQDPKNAAYPGMPQSALHNVRADYCVPIAEMGNLLEKRVRERPGKTKPTPTDVKTEAEIAERVLSDVAQVNGLGDQVPYIVPTAAEFFGK